MNPLEGLSQIPQPQIAVLALTAWTLVWKGLALWHAARVEQKQWFVAVLVLNTLGILEIVYLFVFSKDKLQISQIIDYLKKYSFKPKS